VRKTAPDHGAGHSNSNSVTPFRFGADGTIDIRLWRGGW
jgi:hypothetical protein